MKRIEQLYAFVALDPADGTEGVTGFRLPSGMMMPMVAADAVRVASLREHAREIARLSGTTITLCRFEVRTELEVIEP